MGKQDGIPWKLARDAIWEAVFEVRFSSSREDFSSILPGLLYAELSEIFPTAEQLPFSRLPSEMRNINPMLAYQPFHALKGKNATLRFGQKVATLSITRPYLGWDEFKTLILKCFRAIAKTKYIETVERCSLKYTNLLSEGADPKDLRQLDVGVKLGNFDIADSTTLIRSEFVYGGFTNIVQIVSGATITQAVGDSGPKQGVILDVDTISIGPLGNFEGDLEDVLERLHNTEKAVFFGLLTDETLHKLGPISR